MSRKADKRREAAESLTRDEFLSFVSEVKDQRQDLDDAQMAHAGVWKKADKKGVHPDAAKLALRLDKMEDLKRNDFLRSFDRYRPWLDLDRAPDMLDNVTVETMGDEAGEQQDDGHEPPADEPMAASADPLDIPAVLDRREVKPEEAKTDADWGQAEPTNDEELDGAGFTFSVGRQCALDGTAREGNPHPKGSSAHGLWDKGWLKGSKEAGAADGEVVDLGEAKSKRSGKANPPPPAAGLGEQRPAFPA